MAPPSSPGPSKFISYLREVQALHILVRDSQTGEDIASATFPIVYGHDDFNSQHQGIIPLLCCNTLQCVGHMKFMVSISFPNMSSFEALECQLSNASPTNATTVCNHGLAPDQCIRGTADQTKHDTPDEEANALLEKLCEPFRLNKHHKKEEDPVARVADICALVHAACLR